jgi:hypothetical protein
MRGFWAATGLVALAIAMIGFVIAIGGGASGQSKPTADTRNGGLQFERLGF